MSAKFVVIHAMAEEQAPFYQGQEKRTALVSQGLAFSYLELNEQLSGYSVVSGIGLANAARAATLAASLEGVELILYCGTAGSLDNRCGVGEVVLASSFRYHNADATMFDYQLGQVPGMPAFYESDRKILERFFAPAQDAAPEAAADARSASASVFPGQHVILDDPAGEIKVRSGEVLSGDSFITAANIAHIKANFPQGLATDMETVAAAQVCYLAGVPFGAIRCISDLCSPDSEQVFHLNLDQASAHAVKVCRQVLESYFA